jgi:hypothetical protein
VFTSLKPPLFEKIVTKQQLERSKWLLKMTGPLISNVHQFGVVDK